MTNEVPIPHRNHGAAWQIALAVILLAVYVRTLLPGVGYHPDTAKFQFVGYILGTPHAPGYPTYVVINHFFTKYLPLGTVAFRANLLSSFFAVIACIFLFRILKLFGLKNPWAFGVALAFGFTRTFWSQAIIAEVYSLNALFVVIVLYFLFRWTQSKQDRDLLLACAFYAFSFGNHLTMITLFPAIVYLVWTNDKKVFTKPRLVLSVLLFILLGALQYSYSLWRYYDPTTLYMDMQTPNLDKLLYAVTGAHFKPKMYAFSFSQVLSQRIPMFLGLLWREYFVVLPLILFGIFRMTDLRINIFLILAILGNLFFALNYDIPDIFIYFIPTYMVLAIYLGVALKGISDLVPRSTLAVTAIALLAPAILLAFNFGAVDQHRNRSAERAFEVLKAAGSNAVVFGEGRDLPRMYFLYYLFGEGLYRNNLYVVPYNSEFMVSYMMKNHPYYYREMRRFVPAGLDIYCTTEFQKTALERHGFKLTTVGPELWRVDRSSVKKGSD
jgi:hypothetical protein